MPEIKNVDDYYAHIPTPEKGADDDKKKGGLKLKVKAKKVETPTETLSESANETKKLETVKTPPVAIIWNKEGSVKKVEREDRPAPILAREAAPAREQRPHHHAPSAHVPARPAAPIQAPAPVRYEAPKKEQKAAFRPVISFAPNPFDGIPKPSPDAPKRKEFAPPANDPNKKHSHGGFRKPDEKKVSILEKKHPGGMGGGNGKKSFKSRSYEEDDGTFRRSWKAHGGSKNKEKNVEEIKQTLVDKTGQEILVPEVLTVKEFSEKIGVPLAKIITELMKNGMLVTINTKIDFDTCYLIGESFGVKISREINTDVSVSSLMEGNVSELLKNDDPEKCVPRAPIVSIMGHVDHGKTSILDYIRNTTVASGEAGGITQKIGAYQVEKNGKKITFLDTPGHEAFSIMRSRGAKLTDLAIIVVAADEGMKPQTIESINHARDAGVTIIVAANKMDKPGANLDLIRGQMSEQGLQPEDWGGTTVLVPVSAHTGLGIETLLDMILLSTEMMELKANPDRPAIGTVIESHLDAKLGPLATVLINAGTIKKTDYITCANASGRVRFIRDFRGKNLDEAGPSVPVLISGLSNPVEGGDLLQVMPDSLSASTKAHEFELFKNKKSIHNFEGASLDLLLNRLKTGGLKQLKIVIKCESNGSLEALKNALGKLSTAETQVTFIHSGVGDVNDSDVLMAGTGQAILIAYNVSVGSRAKSTLAQSKIEFIDKKVIYHILERVEAIITGMVDTRYEDVELGEAKVKAIFYTGKDKMIVGLGVTSGKIENRAKIRLIRDGKKIANAEVANLKSGLLDVNEIEAPDDCGISYKGDIRPMEGDILELYKTVIKK